MRAPCAILIALVAAAACQPVMPSPELHAVEPDRGWSGEDTLVTIHGAGFYPRVEMDASRRGRADLDPRFGVWLEGVDGATRFALTGVSAQSYETLRGIVVSGLPAGTYDLVVQGPTGQTGRLQAAYTVADTRADRMVLDTPQLAWQVQQFAQVDLSLVDPHGARVFTDLPVSLRVSRDGGGDVEATFGSGALEDQAVLTDGSGITGSTGVDGFARVLFSVAEPGTYTLTATSHATTSRLDPATLKLLFEPGGEHVLDIRLPDAPDPFEVEAGEAFEVELELRDQYGNPVPDLATTVALRNLCNSWLDLVQVRGLTPVQVQIPTASDPSCAADAILTDPVSAVQGASQAFLVRPGPPHAFSVDIGAGPYTAGDGFLARIGARDAFGNASPWAGSLTLTALPGGEVASTCGLVGAAWMCTGAFTRAGEEVVLQVTGDDGLTGLSAPVVVLHSEVLQTVEVTVDGPVVAGTAAEVEVVARDPWGNTIPPGAAVDWVLTDELGEAGCVFDGVLPSHAASFSCTHLTARSGAVLQASVQGEVGVSAPYEVINGPLAAVHLEVPGSAMVAEPFPVQLQGFDAWGNPYTAQEDPELHLGDSTGTLDPQQVELQADGTASFSATVTGAGLVHLEARRDDRLLGTSPPIEVSPGPVEALRVGLGAAWAWVGEPVVVQVEAVDGWGNRTPDDDLVTLISQETDAPDQVWELVDGVAQGSWTWDDGALHEVLHAEGVSGLVGSSAPLHVVLDCGSEGPVAALTFAGLSEGFACADPASGQGTIAGDFSGSVPGSAPLAAYALAREGEAAESETSPSVLLDLPEVGLHPLHGLVVQADLCADAVTTVAWVGHDDGQPVGPVALFPDDDVLDARADTTEVTVQGARDCAGDPAAGGWLKLRTTLGELLGLTPTGSGLALELDGSGAGRFTLSALPVHSPGQATVHAWGDAGATGGLLSVQVVQDHQPPVVLEQIPAGRVLDLVEEIRLVFSEPLRPNTAVRGNVSVTGPTPVTVLAVTLEAEGTEMVLSLDPPLDGAAGTWMVAAADVRDLAGNRMDGAFSGAPSAWVGYIGDVAPGPDPVICELLDPPSGRFRPDGDPGPGEEADVVTLLASGAPIPTWWVLTAYDAEGDRVVRLHIPGGATTEEELRWSGRDQAGRIVENGTYTLAVEAVDGVGNRSEPCVVPVTVDNHRESLP